MAVSEALTFSKEERICSRKLMDQLFSGAGSHSLVAFPLRAVYMESQEEGVQMLVSVPKRHFKRAVKRNRVKRQVREAYRHHKQLLTDRVGEGRGVAVAFIWLDPHLHSTAKVSSKVENLLQRISERL